MTCGLEQGVEKLYGEERALVTVVVVVSRQCMGGRGVYVRIFLTLALVENGQLQVLVPIG
jgi:hypothetical protein